MDEKEEEEEEEEGWEEEGRRRGGGGGGGGGGGRGGGKGKRRRHPNQFTNGNQDFNSKVAQRPRPEGHISSGLTVEGITDHS